MVIKNVEAVIGRYVLRWDNIRDSLDSNIIDPLIPFFFLPKLYYSINQVFDSNDSAKKEIQQNEEFRFLISTAGRRMTLTLSLVGLDGVSLWIADDFFFSILACSLLTNPRKSA